ncbi:MAG: ATP-binding protein [bacterium]
MKQTTEPSNKESTQLPTDHSLNGFRLKRLEVFNWGTFDQQVWSLNLKGKNALLTGDIGSGKSTLVDAVTTLLVPANKVDYNKAAGAEKKERHLRSYVLGYYKSERNEVTGKSKPVALRDQNNFSVILGVFYNQCYDQTITLAQVFWMKELQGQPQRFYVCAENELSITRDFSQFGTDINRLRKRLRQNDCEIMDHFPQYGAWFRRRFGIDNEQALDLFHQTVSMKSVGNLTQFVRNHMLEPFDVQSRIKALVIHFDDLNRAHQAVQKAREQIELLEPLTRDCDQHQKLSQNALEYRHGRDALSTFYAAKKLKLIDLRLEKLNQAKDKLQNKCNKLDKKTQLQQADLQALKQQIAENGGDRIERLKQEILQLENSRERRQRKFQRYDELLKPLDLQAADNSEYFSQQQQQLQETQNKLQQQQDEKNNQLREIEFSFLRKKEGYQELKQTITELRSRQNNIDQRQISIRQRLCQDLSFEESEFPFVGELLQVREQEQAWEGAIERLLHNFGLSMLIPNAYYEQVSQWVDDTNLKGRLVYYRVREPRQNNINTLHPDSLVRKLSIKPDSGFYSWLEHEIGRRFDLACCDSQQQFRREKRAITQFGQIKAAGERHEKDDRFALNDRSRFILGWSNKEKIAALENKAKQSERQMADLGLEISTLKKQDTQIKTTLSAISKLEEYQDFSELDWKPLANQVAQLQEELKQLESASDILQILTSKLKQQELLLTELTIKLDQAKNQYAKTEQKIEDSILLQQNTQKLTKSDQAQTHHAYFSQLEQFSSQALGQHTLSIESCDHRQQDTRKWLQIKIDAVDKKISTLQGKIVKAMSEYINKYPLETQETDASVAAAADYQEMLNVLQADGLPRFEERFKELLNENTIREVANFQSQLYRERETIKERIALINESLTQIDYNPGRYIKLEAQPSLDADVRNFQTELRACTEGALTGSENEQYSETKFLQVKQIIERFKGREGLTELDRRWTNKVSDVRNWFIFAASERWHEDDKEHEHYSDSGGKSGGQKEKLAYTILAASLAYQFGLEWGTVRSRSFRFVVIDEAFGRGSDESAAYGLRLFEQLNLQLLIVTPLQKIHIIEPHVSNVGYVHNEGGKASKIRNLTIKAYQQEKSQSQDKPADD